MRVPETIFLQWFGDYDPDMLSESERDGIDPDSASWCWEQIFPHDIEFRRRDLADEAMRMLQAEYKELAQQVAELRLDLRRYQEREATMGWNQS